MKVRDPSLNHFGGKPGGTEESNVSQGTRAEGTIAKLFTGKMKSLIKCVDVDYESSSVEEFNGEKPTPRKETRHIDQSDLYHRYPVEGQRNGDII